MHTLIYGSQAEYDKNYDTMSPEVNTAAPWSHRGPLDHNLEHDNCGVRKHNTHSNYSRKNMVYYNVFTVS